MVYAERVYGFIVHKELKLDVTNAQNVYTLARMNPERFIAPDTKVNARGKCSRNNETMKVYKQIGGGGGLSGSSARIHVGPTLGHRCGWSVFLPHFRLRMHKHVHESLPGHAWCSRCSHDNKSDELRSVHVRAAGTRIPACIPGRVRACMRATGDI